MCHVSGLPRWRPHRLVLAVTEIGCCMGGVHWPYLNRQSDPQYCCVAPGDPRRGNRSLPWFPVRPLETYEIRPATVDPLDEGIDNTFVSLCDASGATPTGPETEITAGMRGQQLRHLTVSADPSSTKNDDGRSPTTEHTSA